jgi:hypothetical protein
MRQCGRAAVGNCVAGINLHTDRWLPPPPVAAAVVLASRQQSKQRQQQQHDNNTTTNMTPNKTANMEGE